MFHPLGVGLYFSTEEAKKKKKKREQLCWVPHNFSIQRELESIPLQENLMRNILLQYVVPYPREEYGTPPPQSEGETFFPKIIYFVYEL